MRSFTLAPQGIRINCLNPGPTDTPMMPHFEKAVGKDFMANFPKPLWGRNARPDEQAWPLLFLNSPRSSYVTGVQFDADAGFKAGIFTGQIDPSVLIPESMHSAIDALSRVSWSAGSALRNFAARGAATRPPTPPPSTITANARLPR